MKIKNGFLFYDNGTQVTFKQSPNIGKGVLNPKFTVIHYTATNSASSAVNWMLDPKAKVSAHLHLARDGSLVQLVKFNQVAYHAGESFWKGITGLNSHSIGIEISNDGKIAYTKEQMDVLIEIGKAINESYPNMEYVGHQEIAPKRKTDPGKHFDWKAFRDGMKGITTVKTLSTTTALNLRVKPTTDGEKVAVLPQGTEVNEISRDGDWSQVFVCSSKLTGYVSNKYLK